MGVDTKIMLPDDVQVRDVARVIAILAGCNSKLRPLEAGSDVVCCDVSGYSVDTTAIPEMVTIVIKKNSGLVDGEKNHFVNYHFEPCDVTAGRLIMPRSTPFWIAIGVGLCKFYGGKIDYQDTDSVRVNRRFKRVRANNSPQDNKPWNDFQTEMSKIKPLTMSDLRRANKVAAYTMEDMD